MADAAGPPPRGKNLLKVAGALKKRALEERDEADANAEKKQKHLAAIAKEWICPITHELPIKPVTAEDGKIYEEKAIREWFGTKRVAKSPTTGADIGTGLLPAPQARNIIEELIESGAIAGELAEAWTEKLADEKVVKEWRAKAEGGDGNAMYRLGYWYQEGLHGLAKDEVQARAWYELSAAERDPKGMAMFSSHLLRGIGGPQDNVFGVMNVTQAAELGSEYGAYLLGKAFMTGFWGLPKDPARSRFWLRKVVDDECAHKQLTDLARADAVECLRALGK